MQPPLREVLLVIRAFGHNTRVLRHHLGRLDADLGPAVRRVDAYYRPGADLAMFLCQLDPAGLAVGDPLPGLAARMRSLGGELVDLAALERGHEHKLRTTILPRCEVACVAHPHLAAAVDALLAATGRDAGPGAPPCEPPPRLRFLRGDDWQVGRLGAIEGDQLGVIASAPLRTGERTTVEIVAPSITARLTAVVIDQAEPTSPGTWGFTVRLVADGARRPSDQNVLTWARARLAAARALPPRTEHRTPLHWPARLRDHTGEHLVTVRDVSRGGVFAEMPRAPAGTAIRLRVPYDLGETPLDLTVEVARVVDVDLASHHGIPVGVGLRVRPVPRDTDRYAAFVERIEHRAARHVLIGARQPRLDELTRHFASVGYLTSGCSDLRTLCARAADSLRPPEVVLVDPGLSTPEQLRPRIGRRSVPVIAVEGSPIATRRLVDAALI